MGDHGSHTDMPSEIGGDNYRAFFVSISSVAVMIGGIVAGWGFMESRVTFDFNDFDSLTLNRFLTFQGIVLGTILQLPEGSG